MEVLPLKSVGPDRSIDVKVDAGHVGEEADQVQIVNKKLMRLHVDAKASSKRQSMMFDESAPTPSPNDTVVVKSPSFFDFGGSLQIRKFSESDVTRFPRIEEMSHFHYNSVEFSGSVVVALCVDENEDNPFDVDRELLVRITCRGKSWIAKRSYHDFVGFDRQVHRCLYDRRYSQLPLLPCLPKNSDLSANMVQELQQYLTRFSEVAGNNVNCGPILNWLEIDNHGNHLVVMEADDSAINVPAICACCVIKRYVAQAPDEITLEVGEFLSVIDMPPIEETVWWRGKKGYEVGFFPSHCVEILGEKDLDDKHISQIHLKPVTKPRGKFITFLRFFFKARPSKDELMQHGILRERVFGCDLGDHLAHTGRAIPLILEMCADVIEECGMVDGIYRLSGTVSNLQRLRFAFDSDDCPPDLRDQRYLNDIHCISSLLKTYFRELPNPLFTYELYDKFTSAICMEDDKEKTFAFHHAIQRLPPPHYRTMEYLLRHLNYCSERAKGTNMTAKNLAIVWSPNLVKPQLDDNTVMLSDIRTQAIIVEYMIRNVAIFFDKNLASAAIAFYPEILALDIVDPLAVGKAPAVIAPPKLISLEEARARVKENMKVSATSSTEANYSSQFHKLRSVAAQAPKVAAAPVSPLPGLLSLAEAQARTKEARQDSADLDEARLSASSPRPKQRKWLALFSKIRNATSLEQPVVDSPKTDEFYDRKSGRHESDAQFESAFRWKSSSDVKDFKKHAASPSLGYRTSSFTSYTGSQAGTSPSGPSTILSVRDNWSRSSSASSIEAGQPRIGEFGSVVSVKAHIVESSEVQPLPGKHKLPLSAAESVEPRVMQFVPGSAARNAAPVTGADSTGLLVNTSNCNMASARDMQFHDLQSELVRGSGSFEIGAPATTPVRNMADSSIKIYRSGSGHKREPSVDSGTADDGMLPPSPDSFKCSCKHEREFSLDSGAGDSLPSWFLPSSPDDETAARDVWVRRSAQIAEEHLKFNSNSFPAEDAIETPYKKYGPASSIKLPQSAADKSDSMPSTLAKTFQRSLSAFTPKQKLSEKAVTCPSSRSSPTKGAVSQFIRAGSVDGRRLRLSSDVLDHRLEVNDSLAPGSDVSEVQPRTRMASLTRAARKKSKTVDVVIVEPSFVCKPSLAYEAAHSFSNSASNYTSNFVSNLPRRIPLHQISEASNMKPSTFIKNIKTAADFSGVTSSPWPSDLCSNGHFRLPSEDPHANISAHSLRRADQRTKDNAEDAAGESDDADDDEAFSKGLSLESQVTSSQHNFRNEVASTVRAPEQTDEQPAELSNKNIVNNTSMKLVNRASEASLFGDGNALEFSRASRVQVSAPESLLLSSTWQIDDDKMLINIDTESQAASPQPSLLASSKQPVTSLSVRERARHFSHIEQDTAKVKVHSKQDRPRSEVLSSYAVVTTSQLQFPASSAPVRASSEKIRTRPNQEKDATESKPCSALGGRGSLADSSGVPFYSNALASGYTVDAACVLDSNDKGKHFQNLPLKSRPVSQPKVALAHILSQSDCRGDAQYDQPSLVVSTTSRNLNDGLASRRSDILQSASKFAFHFSERSGQVGFDLDAASKSSVSGISGVRSALKVASPSLSVKAHPTSILDTASGSETTDFHREARERLLSASNHLSGRHEGPVRAAVDGKFICERNSSLEAQATTSPATAGNHEAAAQATTIKTELTSDMHRISQAPAPGFVVHSSSPADGSTRSAPIGDAKIDRPSLLQPSKSMEGVARVSGGALGRWQVEAPFLHGKGDYVVRETLLNTFSRDTSLRRVRRSEGDDQYAKELQKASARIFGGRVINRQNDKRKSAPVKSPVRPLPRAMASAASFAGDKPDDVGDGVEEKPPSYTPERTAVVVWNELANLSDHVKSSHVHSSREKNRNIDRPFSMQESMSENYMAVDGSAANASSFQIGNFLVSPQAGEELATCV